MEDQKTPVASRAGQAMLMKTVVAMDLQFVFRSHGLWPVAIVVPKQIEPDIWLQKSANTNHRIRLFRNSHLRNSRHKSDL